MAFSIVVLPDPVPPEISTLSRASTRPRISVAAAADSVPISTMRSSVRGLRENLRIETDGPSIAQGRMIALTRLPSSSRASTQGCRLVNAAADPADDLVDDPQKVAFIPKAGLGFFENAEAFDIDRPVRVHEDVVDRRVGEQRLQRPEAQHLVQQFVDQLLELLGAHGLAFVGEGLRHETCHFAPQLVGLDFFDHGQIQTVQQHIVQPAFQFQPRDQFPVEIRRFNAHCRCGRAARKLNDLGARAVLPDECAEHD